MSILLSLYPRALELVIVLSLKIYEFFFVIFIYIDEYVYRHDTVWLARVIVKETLL